ncbi:MAG: hypothetical protein ACOZQL_03495 [Myxococcota bacterium]
MQRYLPVLDRIDPTGRLRRIFLGDVVIGVVDQPPEVAVFPPGFVPLVGRHTFATGAWLMPFSEPKVCFGDYIVEAPNEGGVVCTDVEDLLRYLAIIDWENNPELDAERASALAELQVSLDFTRVAQNNLQGLAPRESLLQLGARTAALPRFASPGEVFERALATRELGLAWSALNSAGWTISQARAALVVLQDLADSELLGLLVAAWVAYHDRLRPDDGY